MVGDGSDCGPAPCGGEGPVRILKWLAFDNEFNLAAPALLAVNPFAMDVSVDVLVVAPLELDVPALPVGFVWLGRMLNSALPRRGLCLVAVLSGGGDIGGDAATWYTCTCILSMHVVMYITLLYISNYMYITYLEKIIRIILNIELLAIA